ncbi:MAG TPA: hypothetical protein DHW82_03530 [Spirochaetia bacterium]|nr:MAG: hypothetical protein A2Y41_06380 [Spirochaetes bacterium GWB1_36_13]HCL56064.1 hypothetical protein [Spirochaetia bacterium]
MKKTVFFCLLTLNLFASPSAYEVIQKGEEVMRGKTSFSKVEIQIEKPRFTRSILLESYDSRDEDKFFIRILEPKKDKNTTFLKIEKNLWQYIPKIGKEIKIEASLLGDSWMGSDFTNDDLVKQSSIVDDYSQEFLESEDNAFYKIELLPKPGSTAPWSRIIIFSKKSDFLPVREEFYDFKGRLKKVMLLSDFKEMGGRVTPLKMEMQSIENGEAVSKTVLIYQEIRFNLKIEDFIFTKAYLRKSK